MCALTGWEEQVNPGGQGGSSTTQDGKPRPQYLKIAQGETARLRILGKPMKFLRYFEQTNGKWRRVIVAEEHKNDNPIKLKYGKKPELRYSVNVIDRKDGGFKIWEFTHNVYMYFVGYFDIAKKEPGGPEGVDFNVSRTLTEGGRTTYVVKPLDFVPFTPKEAEYIKNVKVFNLPEIYASTPIEDMEKYLYGFEATASNAQPSTQAQAPQEQPAAQPPSAAVITDDDLNF